MCAGDPAVDLAAAWVLLPAGAAARFFDAYAHADEAMIRRARGLAAAKSLFLIWLRRKPSAAAATICVPLHDLRMTLAHGRDVATDDDEGGTAIGTPPRRRGRRDADPGHD
jgi:hypothetical protein